MDEEASAIAARNKASRVARKAGVLVLVAVAAGALLTPRSKRRIAAGLEETFGWLDERWYWLYQGVLCRLGENPAKADRMYSRAFPE